MSEIRTRNLYVAIPARYRSAVELLEAIKTFWTYNVQVKLCSVIFQNWVFIAFFERKMSFSDYYYHTMRYPKLNFPHRALSSLKCVNTFFPLYIFSF